eukprot:4309711-Alexandrium_andersonii.AAC.1
MCPATTTLLSPAPELPTVRDVRARARRQTRSEAGSQAGVQNGGKNVEARAELQTATSVCPSCPSECTRKTSQGGTAPPSRGPCRT